jgi:Flp pilus assembly protein TadG
MLMSMQLRLPRSARRFIKDTRAVSAVEFALLLPLMLTMYLGGSEVAQAIATSRKVTLVTRTIADLASQPASITDATMTNMLDASAAVIAPYASSKLKVTVSQVKIDANSNATIVWSDTRGGTEHTDGESVTLPATLKVANTYLIWSEVEFNYVPTFGSGITGSMALRDRMYMRPRLSTDVKRTAN